MHELVPQDLQNELLAKVSPHAQKKNMLKEEKHFILVLGKKNLNNTSSSKYARTILSLGRS